MDPTACLRRINDATRIDSLDCREAIADLARWLANGGFAPDWSAHPLGAKRFARRCPNLYAIEGKGPDTFKAPTGTILSGIGSVRYP